MSDTRGLGLRNAPPHADSVTDYDLAWANHYLRLLAAHEEGAPWEEAASVVLGLDCETAPDHAWQVHASHLARAQWIAGCGFMDLLKRGKCDQPSKPGNN
jgi:hypothetical protein